MYQSHLLLYKDGELSQKVYVNFVKVMTTSLRDNDRTRKWIISRCSNKRQWPLSRRYMHNIGNVYLSRHQHCASYAKNERSTSTVANGDPSQQRIWHHYLQMRRQMRQCPADIHPERTNKLFWLQIKLKTLQPLLPILEMLPRKKS